MTEKTMAEHTPDMAAAPNLLAALKLARQTLADNGFVLSGGHRHPVVVKIDDAIDKATSR